MSNIRTAINALAAAKETCYELASKAYDKGDIAEQKRLYELADATQAALNAAMIEEQTQERLSLSSAPKSDADLDLDDFSETA